MITFIIFYWEVLRFIFVILQFLEFHFGIKLWFTAHFILLTTPKLLKEEIQQYLTGLLIIFQGSSIITSSESLGESIMKPQSLAGNGIFLSCLTLQFVSNYLSHHNHFISKKDTYHAVVFTHYDLCTKFVVSCDSNFNFP